MRRSSRSCIPTSIRRPRRSPMRSARRVGAQTRILGGLGAFESVSVRGAAPGHTVVLIDGVPLARHRRGHDRPRAVRARRVRRGRPLSRRGAGRARRRGRRRRGQPRDAARARRARRAAGARRSARARSARVTCALHYGDDHGALRSSTTIGYQARDRRLHVLLRQAARRSTRPTTATTSRSNNAFDQLDARRASATDTARVGGVRLAWKDQGLPGTIVQPGAAAASCRRST